MMRASRGTFPADATNSIPLEELPMSDMSSGARAPDYPVAETYPADLPGHRTYPATRSRTTTAVTTRRPSRSPGRPSRPPARPRPR